jgi:hypothetical protein
MPRQRQVTICSSALLCGIALGVSAASGQGIGAGARLFVTKAYPAHGDLSAADFNQLANAGFTDVVNFWNWDAPATFAQRAATAGLGSVTWRPGLVDSTSSTDQTINYLGNATRYTTPYSTSAWTEIKTNIKSQATLSLSNAQYKGALLDFEIYDANQTNGFAESYDNASFKNFLITRNISPSQAESITQSVAPSQRRNYLSGFGQLDNYINYQANLVAAQVATLRQEVDAINPNFQIGVYGWGPMIDAVKRSAATAQAPVIDLNAATYGRNYYSNEWPDGYDSSRPDRPGLKWSLLTDAQLAADARARDYPAVLLGGHYAQAPGPADGSQYKFLVRQSFNSAAYADGYWVWTDWITPSPFPTRQAWIDAMMSYFAEGNAAVEAQDWTWASRQMDSIVDPDATPKKLVLTRNAQNEISAWDPVTGFPVSPLDANVPSGSWQSVLTGDVDLIAGDERVELQSGSLKIFDPQSNTLLLRFNVGGAFTGMQLVDPVTRWIAASGDWNNAANWSFGIPNGSSARPAFRALTSPQTIYTNSGVTVGGLLFDSPQQLLLTGAGSLTVDAVGGSATITVLQGAHTINLPLFLNDNTTADVAAGAALTISDPLTVASGKTLTKSGAGTLSILSIVSNSSPATLHTAMGVTNASLDLGTFMTISSSGGTTNLKASQHLAGMTVSGGKVVIGPSVNVVAVTKSLSMTGTGEIDLRSSKLVVNYSGGSALAGLMPALTAGRLTSSLLTTDSAIGYGEASDLFVSFPAIFAGESIDSTTLLFTRTIIGDASLDGLVNSTDFNLFTGHYGQAISARWTQGDFNRDARVDTLDFNLLAGHFGQALPVSAPLGAVVPEPSHLMILSAAGILLRRRKEGGA